MLYAIRKSDNKEFPVQNYSVQENGSIEICCEGWANYHNTDGDEFSLTWKPKGMYGIEWGFSFEAYLIKVGEESCDYKFDMEVLMANTDYFRDCYNRHLSAYKAMCFFGLYLEEKENVK